MSYYKARTKRTPSTEMKTNEKQAQIYTLLKIIDSFFLNSYQHDLGNISNADDKEYIFFQRHCETYSKID